MTSTSSFFLKKALVFLGILFLFFSPSPGVRDRFATIAADSDDALLLYKNYLVKLDLEKSDFYCSGEKSTKSTVTGRPDVESVKSLLIAHNGSNRLIRQESLQEENTSDKPVVSERFDILKNDIAYYINGSVVGGPYYATKFGPATESEMRTFEYYTRDLLCVSYSLFSKSILSLFDDPNFSVTKVERVLSPIGQQWEIWFTYNFSTKGSKLTGSGSFTVDPNNAWCLTSSHINTTEIKKEDVNKAIVASDKYDTDVDYNPLVNGKPIPRTIKSKVQSKFNNKLYDENEVFLFKEYHWKPYPSTAFQLAHYGLGDLEQNDRSNFIRYGVYLLIAASILFVSSIVIRKRYKSNFPN